MKKRLIYSIIGGITVAIIISIFSIPLISLDEPIKENDTPPTPIGFPREWISSGPFKIDKTKYLLDENIFVTVSGLKQNEKGEIVFLRPLNKTHTSEYHSIPFDGSLKSEFNQYFTPELSKLRKICNPDDLLGNWTVVFEETNYPSLKFEIINKTIPGSEIYFEPVC